MWQCNKVSEDMRTEVPMCQRIRESRFQLRTCYDKEAKTSHPAGHQQSKYDRSSNMHVQLWQWMYHFLPKRHYFSISSTYFWAIRLAHDTTYEATFWLVASQLSSMSRLISNFVTLAKNTVFLKSSKIFIRFQDPPSHHKDSERRLDRSCKLFQEICVDANIPACPQLPCHRSRLGHVTVAD